MSRIFIAITMTDLQKPASETGVEGSSTSDDIKEDKQTESASSAVNDNDLQNDCRASQDIKPNNQNDQTGGNYSDNQNIEAECEKLLRNAKRQVSQTISRLDS